MYKNQLDLKQKEIVKLQTKIKVLNTNSSINHRNECNNNSNTNLSMLIKSKVNSTFCTINKDESDHTKQKCDDIYNIYNQNNENNYFNKNRTMSNIKPSRNNNYFTIMNKPSNKNNINNNISQQNTIININSYLQKNFSSNSLRKNTSSNHPRKNYSSSKKKDLKQNSNNNNSLNITNNTYNMNKNNIMINVNPKNISTNMNLEKIKVQNKLHEYQRLIDQKLNELINNRHFYDKNIRNVFHKRRNSSPNYNNSQRKNTSSSVGLEYYLKKGKKKKSITPNLNTHLNKNNNASKKQLIKQNIHSMKSRKNNQRSNSQSQSVKKNRNAINNMKQNLNKGSIYSKVGDDIQNEKNTFPKNVILYFSDENKSLQQNSQIWVEIINQINTLPELKLPFIIFLSYGDIEDIRNQVGENGGIFGDFRDKRKITILRLLKNENQYKEMNYRKILSYLWKITLILNQKSFRPSKNLEANLYSIQERSPSTTINILLTGFSRKGKSTFINMVFGKIVTLENPSFLPVTSEIIEFLLPSQPSENDIVKGGLKLFDVPGLIEGTSENMSNIEKLIEQSIKNQEYNYDVISYILFFLSPAPNFQNTSNFLKKLNESGIKVIFIINRDHPINNGSPNITKQTLIDHLSSRGFTNLIEEDGNNILEIDLINGVKGRTNEIFRYMYNDLMNNNEINDNVMNEIINLQGQELFPYLRDKFNLFSRISSTEDLINRGNNKAKVIIEGTIPLTTAAGFCPIPFIDIPIFLFIISLMLTKICNSFGFNLENSIFNDFFIKYLKEIERGNNDNTNANENQRNSIRARILNWLTQNFRNANNDVNQFIIQKLIDSFEIRIGVTALAGFFDLMPGGFIIGGIIDAIINYPFINQLGNEAKIFMANKIRASGGKKNIINIIESYRESISILEELSNRNEWPRKIEIID